MNFYPYKNKVGVYPWISHVNKEFDLLSVYKFKNDGAWITSTLVPARKNISTLTIEIDKLVQRIEDFLQERSV